MLKKFTTLLCVGALTLAFVGCEKADDAAIDTTDTVGEVADDTVDATEHAADEAVEAVEE